MISSIFGRTKPINYIILLVFLFFFYWFVHFFMFQKSYSPEQLMGQTVILGFLSFSIFVVNFIVLRNKITGGNSLAILFYTLLIVLFPEVLIDSNAILCSFFLLLSIRRILSFRSLKNIKLKIFDATFWILIASLFYDWAILYLVVIIVAIYFYEPKNITNWLVPFTAIIAMVLIMLAVLALGNNMDFLRDHYYFDFQFNAVYFYDWSNSTILFLYVSIVLLCGFLAFLKLGSVGVGKIVTMRLVVLFFFIGLLVKVLKSAPDTHPILITFFPAVVFITTYVQSIKKDSVREIVLMASVIVPFIVFLTNALMK
ncbi:membrane protein [Arenibacter algicola]|uniref:Membrane protein n=2 Tax=Arenibacter algicola TaxID=616991 RepID=A0A221UU54_9FLAO|nr:membrane protein [Arenibacter algicola]